MNSTLPPPPAAAPKRRGSFPRLSKDPEKRSIQIGVLGTVLFHLLLILLAPYLLRSDSGRIGDRPHAAPRQFSIELAPDAFKPPPKPSPDRFVETNPDAPENEPDKTRNFGAQNQQVAQEKPTPDGKNDAPALEGKKDFESNQIVSGQLTKEVERVPPSPPAEAAPEQKPVTAPKLEQNPLAGFEKKEGDDTTAYGTNIAKLAENTPQATEKVEGVKNVPLIQGATGLQPEIDPQRPRPRPTIVKQQQVRPAIFAENKLGTSNIGPIAYDARWSNYGAYLQRMIEAVQMQWEHLLNESHISPPPGTWVAVKFIINSEGIVTRIADVDSHSTDQGSRACSSAITDRSPYGKWTDDMVAVLGDQQELTFRFYYQ